MMVLSIKFSVHSSLPCIIVVLIHLFNTQSWAQITLDGSLGPQRSLTGPEYVVPDEVGQTRGTNLFHSFGDFNVHAGERATFTGPAIIDNIIARVTGGNASHLDGLLRSEIDGANFFLLNPSGVVFGPNAMLDIKGSFHVSTADLLRFADGATFSVDLSQKSTLTMAPPSAFGFLQANPAGIALQGSRLDVPTGETLSVIGGDIVVDGGRLTAPSGRVYIASAAASGDVVPSLSAQPPTLDMQTVERHGRVQLSQGTRVQTHGERSGTVVIRSGRLVMEHSSIVTQTRGALDGAEIGIDLGVVEDIVMNDNATLETHSSSAGRSGDIRIATKRLALTGGAFIDTSTTGLVPGGNVSVTVTDAIHISGRGSFRSGMYSETYSQQESGGAITLSAPRLNMSDTGVIETLTTGSGRGGRVVVEAATVSLADGAQIASNTAFGARGQAGDVTVTATERLSIAGQSDDERDRSGIFSRSTGSAHGGTGELWVSAALLEMSDGGRMSTPSTGMGNAGNIAIQVEQLTIKGGAAIASDLFGVAGQGGSVTVVATESIAIDGRDNMGMRSGIFSETTSEDAGVISISTPMLDIRDGGIIAARTGGAGAAGNIEVNVDQLVLSSGGRIDSSTVAGSTGPGGRITITATAGVVITGRDRVNLLNRSGLSSETAGSGKAGSVTVTAPSVHMSAGSLITRSLGTGQGGDVTVDSETVMLTNGALVSAESSGMGEAGSLRIAARQLTLRDDSTVTTTVGRGAASGGNILIGAALRADGAISAGVDTLTLDGSRITANTDTGDGANITIGTQRMILDRASHITANTGDGTGGNIIVAGEVSADGRIATRAAAVVLRGSRITANAAQGTGGRIDIVTETFLADPDSVVDASSQEGGIDGEVNIEAVVTNLSEVVRPLSQRLASETPLLRDRCAARLQHGLVSSFVERERAGIPSSPDGLLPSRLETQAAEAVSPSSSLPYDVAMASDKPWRLRSRCP